MTTAITETSGSSVVEQVVIGGDLSRLNPNDRVVYYNKVCQSLGLNPLTTPFAYINLNGKLTLYAKRDCTEQLRKINRVSIQILSREMVEDCYVVTARATTPTRQDESIGAVSIAGLRGEARANAMMKAETKAKRRVTLSVCGLGMLDETEVDTIPGAKITPSAGVAEALTAESYARVNEVAKKMREWLDQGSVGDAVAEFDNANLDAEEQIATWERFASKERAAMKKEQERLREERRQKQAAQTITDAQKKRLEARIHELGLNRTAVKLWCANEFSKEHFADLTQAEYDTLDSQLESMAKKSSPPPASSDLPSELPLSPSGTVRGEDPDVDEALLIKARDFAECGTEKYKAWWAALPKEKKLAIGQARHEQFKEIAAKVPV